MSIYATNYVIDELTGEPKLIKRLNKQRIDRNYTWGASGGWNKNGKKARKKKNHEKGEKKKEYKSFNEELLKDID